MVLSIQQIEAFLFILGRIAGIFIQAPIFSSRSFPAPAKTALAIWISLVLWFVVPVNAKSIDQGLFAFIMLLVVEVAIGFAIGFVCNTIFLAVQSAGELIDLQMGLSVSQEFDPIFGASISIIGRLLFMVALMVFLMVNGHHLILQALNQSFRLIPAGARININPQVLLPTIINVSQILWTVGLQLAGPIILIIFLSDFAFGIVSRVAPQVNVFMLGFQVKPALGLICLLFTLPLLVKHIAHLVSIMGEEVLKLLLAIKI